MLFKSHLTTSFLFFAILLSGCATPKPISETTSTINTSQSSESLTCIGQINPPPDGLQESTNSLLLQKALGNNGEGKLCKGKVYEATKAVTVYRVWDKDKDYTLYGGWWSFELPQGTREEYRVKNDICPSWSPLNQMSSCTLKVGSKIVVGPGQSATCKHSTLPQSPVNQVYIPNDSRNNILFVENCTEGKDWP